MTIFDIKLYEDSPIGEDRVELPTSGKLCVREDRVSHVWEDDSGVVILVVDGVSFVIEGKTLDEVVWMLGEGLGHE